MENPIKMDDLGIPLFLETPIYVSPSQKKGTHLGQTRLRKGLNICQERDTLQGLMGHNMHQ